MNSIKRIGILICLMNGSHIFGMSHKIMTACGGGILGGLGALWVNYKHIQEKVARDNTLKACETDVDALAFYKFLAEKKQMLQYQFTDSQLQDANKSPNESGRWFLDKHYVGCCAANEHGFSYIRRIVDTGYKVALNDEGMGYFWSAVSQNDLSPLSSWIEGCQVLKDALIKDVSRCWDVRDLLEAEKKNWVSWNTWYMMQRLYAYAWYGKGEALKGCALGAAGALALRYAFKR